MAGSSATNLMGLMSGINQGFQGLGRSLDPMFQNMQDRREKQILQEKKALASDINLQVAEALANGDATALKRLSGQASSQGLDSLASAAVKGANDIRISNEAKEYIGLANVRRRLREDDPRLAQVEQRMESLYSSPGVRETVETTRDRQRSRQLQQIRLNGEKEEQKLSLTTKDILLR